jgi:hypothetical protein
MGSRRSLAEIDEHGVGTDAPDFLEDVDAVQETTSKPRSRASHSTRPSSAGSPTVSTLNVAS